MWLTAAVAVVIVVSKDIPAGRGGRGVETGNEANAPRERGSETGGGVGGVGGLCMWYEMKFRSGPDSLPGV